MDIINKLLSIVAPETHRNALVGKMVSSLPNHAREIRDTATEKLMRTHHDEVTIENIGLVMNQVAARSDEDGARYAFKIASLAITEHEKIAQPAYVGREAYALGKLASAAITTAFSCIDAQIGANRQKAQEILLDFVDALDAPQGIRQLAVNKYAATL